MLKCRERKRLERSNPFRDSVRIQVLQNENRVIILKMMNI